jgi:hypothetical protein
VEIHHSPADKLRVAVLSTGKKLSPLIVTFVSPVGAKFPSTVLLNTGPSKLKSPVRVPTFAATLTNVVTAARYAVGAHWTVVPDVQLVQVQSAVPINELVGDRFTDPKFVPLIATKPPMVRGKFMDAGLSDTTGASNVNSLPRVPATPATLTPVRIEPPEYGGTKHCTDVPDVQPVVEHTSSTASELVADGSTL